jgi:C2 domain
VALVMEDCFVRTDMLWDSSLHPRWMPWSMRAFCFHVQHPATALLRLGVFDYDEHAANPLEVHDPIGRVAIHVHAENFLPNTNYILKYQLQHDHHSASGSDSTTPLDTTEAVSNHNAATKTIAPLKLADHPDRGTITIRLRVKWSNEIQDMRRVLMEPPPRFIINCKTLRTHEILRYIMRGSVDREQASVDSIKLYAKELKTFWKRYCYFLDVVLETLLWRGRFYYGKRKGDGGTTTMYDNVIAGQCPTSGSFWFPLSSIVLSTAIILTIERPHLFPSIFCYSIAYIMLTIR